MKEQTKRNLKTAATVTGLALGATYLVMHHIAKKQYPDSVYANQPEEQNPVQGRKVVFVENANDPVNADGKQGTLKLLETAHISRHSMRSTSSVDLTLFFPLAALLF